MAAASSPPGRTSPRKTSSPSPKKAPKLPHLPRSPYQMANAPSSSFSATAAVPVSSPHPASKQADSLTLHDAVAEKTFKSLATISQEKEEINCVAVSHSSEEATERWLPQVGGTWKVNVVVDSERDLYAQWGLGLSSTLHAISPSVLWSAYKLGTTEGIWNRPTESGSRWQKSGAFAVDRFGNVCWKHVSQSANDIPDFEEALQALLRK